MLSYHADADSETNPYELGLDRLVDLEMDADFIGKAARRRIREEGVSRRQVDLRIEAARLEGPNTTFWPIDKDGKTVGEVTSAVNSPRLEQNIAVAMLAADTAELGTLVEAAMPRGSAPAVVVERPFFDPDPFFDPKKKLVVG